MLKKFTVLLSLTLMSLVGFSQAVIMGKVLDEKGEPAAFANVKIIQNGLVKTGGSTNFDGDFKISNLEGGTYDIEVSYVGYDTYRLEGVKVSSGKTLPLNTIKLKLSGELPQVEVIAYKVPLIDKDAGASGGTVTREDIARMPGRSAASIASTVGGVQSDANGNITSVRGSREDASYYFIDGIKVRGSSNLPKAAIEEVSVMTGGLPANYGDATGGIISITTRGASRFYFGGLEYVTSGWKIGDKTYGLDNYGHNLLEGIISGPLLSRKDSTGKKGDPILGFFISGNFTHDVDPRPLARDFYRLSPDAKERLLEAPLRPSPFGTGTFYEADFLRENDFEKIKFRQNVGATNVSLAGKIDVNAGPNVNLTFGGSGNYRRRNFLNEYADMLMNYQNNPLQTNTDWRAYGKFTQRFQAQQDETGKKGGISNAYYTIMVDYSRGTQTIENDIHRDRIFNYGYVGRFETELIPSYEFRDYDENGIVDRVHNGFQEVQVTYTPSQLNGDLAAVTSHYYQLFDGQTAGNYENLNQIINGGALINGFRPRDTYNLWRTFGYTYNNYQQNDNAQFRLTAMGSADIGKHAVTLGFEYEQRVDRGFSASPVGLWNQMRLLANNHISELDESKVYVETFGSFFSYTFERLNAAPGEYTGDDAQAFFDYNLRQALGGTDAGWDPDGTRWIDLDALDPNMFTLDMFSADELLNNGQQLVTYFGYDHTGKRLSGKPSFDDFFTAKDEYGNFKRQVGAYEPIYIAGYIMDKFAFNDLIFNVGVRVDRFDANQQVLKDRFLLYPARTIAEVSEVGGTAVTHPTSLPSDAVVYVNDMADPTAVNGYRVGSTWYNSLGQEIADPRSIYASTGIAPYLADGVDPNQPINSGVFRDYKPQISVMPRIAFSFPISDEALFFAHYDVLTKRPTTGNRLDPFDYFYMRNRNEILNNPDLRPEKTIDYELGFQQVLTKRSSLKISGFYREQRDQVTLINTLGAYPVTYRTWGNIDFGTIKGMTLAYDLRRSGNISMRASYTMQFAEGTGSDPQAQQGLINSGQPNLRTIFPYSYDQRHQIVVAMDYRYGEGKDYNGPIIGEKQILKNTGANLVANFASGTPYSAQENILPGATIGAGSGILEGTVNGSRKPWNFRADLQIDRNIILKFGEEKKKSANLNIYLLVNNVFNTMNVLNVYRATGNADDDGFLNAAEWQNQINSQNDVESYRMYYMMKMDNPFNFGIPRTIRLGVKLDF
jgi:hypothetical protein